MMIMVMMIVKLKILYSIYST